jgi:predicted permease
MKPPRWLIEDADREAIDRDIDELFDIRRAADGDRAARRWRRRQYAGLITRLLADRLALVLRPRRIPMSHVWRDCTHAVRSLGRAPLATLTIVLTVGIALGATTAMTRVVHAVLLTPLPYADAANLYWIHTDSPPFRFRFSVVDYRALEADHPAFAAVAAYQTTDVTVTAGETAERVTMRSVTGSYFPLLGHTAAVGRLFTPADDEGDRIAVLTHAWWTRRFGADPGVVGRSLLVDGVPHVVVGVLGGREGPLERDTALFTAERWPEPRRKGPFFTMVIGRLKPEATPSAAAEALRATNARLFPIWRSSYQDEKATWGLQPLRERAIGDTAPAIYLAWAAVACVLLIACVNAVTLLIARGLQRAREMAIRSALGASGARLVQLVLAESLVLTAASAVVGGLLAHLALRAIPRFQGAFVPRLNEATWSSSVVAWLVALASAAGLVLFAGGLLPAIRPARAAGSPALRSGDRGATDGPGVRRLRRLLVGVQFALATPLLVAAVLVGASLDRLQQVPVGVDVSRLFTASVSLAGPRYENEDARAAFWKQAIETLGALPGVEAAAVADSRPPADAGQRNNFDLEDRPTQPGENQPVSTWVGVTPEFFAAVGLPLERGRLLDDRSLQEDAVVVDRAWAERFFPGQDAVGRRMKSGGCTTCPWTTVVGVVPTVKWTGLEAIDDGTVYYPLVDLPSAYVVVRAAGRPDAIAGSVRQAMRTLDSGLALSDLASGPQLIADSLATPRYLGLVVGLFAAAAALLALVGVYGVVAYFVQQQTREIGIRLALGADPARVRRMVVGHGLALVLSGVAVGLGAAMLSTRFIDSMLFGVRATDPVVLGGVAAGLAAVAAAACLLPGRRAAALDPAKVLRQ